LFSVNSDCLDVVNQKINNSDKFITQDGLMPTFTLVWLLAGIFICLTELFTIGSCSRRDGNQRLGGAFLILLGFEKFMAASYYLAVTFHLTSGIFP
jgi:hypothetical protein